ncbi:hypothetical protein [Pricia sp.]|uniref:hypothetical protein n=1 Tax=Pricia sp. TaxID=2268138 RepID=UPI0035944019
MGNGVWMIVDRDYIDTLTRSGNRLSETAKESHFLEHQSFAPNQILPLADATILVGHPNETKSLTYKVGINGSLEKKPYSFILDTDKRIIAKPESDKEVVKFLEDKR